MNNLKLRILKMNIPKNSKCERHLVQLVVVVLLFVYTRTHVFQAGLRPATQLKMALNFGSSLLGLQGLAISPCLVHARTLNRVSCML